ncbi:hypothetical protein FB451DRAFT_961001, partial [Mycena latifolia]
CSNCKTHKTLGEFKTKTNGTCSLTCLVCQHRIREAAQRKKAEKENRASAATDAEEEDQGSGLGVLPLAVFLDALTQQDDHLKLEARVDISSIS